MGELFFRRCSKPWYYLDILFRLSPLGRQQQKNLNILHGLTRSVIRTRKQELLESSEHQTGEDEDGVLGEEG
jgi:cytochrome P450 family 4